MFDFKSVKSLNELFLDETRAEKFSLKAGEIFCDFSKNNIDESGFAALFEIVEGKRVAEKIKDMFDGKRINTTENRAVLHTALRADAFGRGNLAAKCRERGDHEVANGVAEVGKVLTEMGEFCESVRSGEWRLSTGKRVKNVVNIGIGGSDLGLVMSVTALTKECDKGLKYYFVSNVDSADLAGVLAECEPEETLFVVVSKTFTTQETMLNAARARKWLVSACGEEAVERHFVAASTNYEAMAKFGVKKSFAFWDFVGGRFSVWGAVGLTLMLAVGREKFAEFLEGAREVDEHFLRAPLRANLPVVLAALDYLNRVIFERKVRCVLAYPFALRHFVRYLQQLEMESNGKGVGTSGLAVGVSGAVVFGECGINAQHAFMQLVHHSPDVVPVDFVVERGERELNANALAQARALMRGRSLEEARAGLLAKGVSEERAAAVAPHRVFGGNRPSNFFVMERLCAKSLGALVALYEHRTFVFGALVGINSFDQWGVELGKELCGELLSDGLDISRLDGSTRRLLGMVF